MWPYHPDLLARPVPRYTSYPTAMEFDQHVGRSNQARALETIAAGTPASLYVHIPYCREICWYCGCNTGAANRSARLSGYLDALEREILTVARQLRHRARIDRIAFGGGSPNAVPPIRFVRLLDRLITEFDAANAQISIELDPRTLDDDWYAVIAAARVASASLGCQTFAPHVQAAIGRIQPLAMIEPATARLRAAGVTSLNFDLMYGLPGQSRDDLEATLSETIRLAPERIALFGYAHLPAAISRQRRIDARQLPGPRERFDHAALGFDRLTRAGYDAVGFDHFARPGDPLAIAARHGRLRRNFQGFTDDPSPLVLGLGASAISLFPDLIVQNEKLAGRYRMLVTSGHLASSRGVARPADVRMRAAIIEQLLCSRHAHIPGEILAPVRGLLGSFADRGLLVVGTDSLTITPAGLPYARVIAAAFDSYRSGAARPCSHAV